MEPRPADQVPAAPVTAGRRAAMQVLIGASEAPNFAMRRFRIEPGGGMPAHTNQVEHEQYVLSGSAAVGIGERTFQVRAGDAVLIPARVPHWYRTLGSEPFVFLCLVPNQPDRIDLTGGD